MDRQMDRRADRLTDRNRQREGQTGRRMDRQRIGGQMDRWTDGHTGTDRWIQTETAYHVLPLVTTSQ